MSITSALPGLHQAPTFAALATACSTASACIGLAADQLTTEQPLVAPQQRASMALAGLAGGLILGGGMGAIVALRPRYDECAHLSAMMTGVLAGTLGPMVGAAIGDAVLGPADYLVPTQIAVITGIMGVGLPLWAASVAGVAVGVGWVLLGAPGLSDF